MKSLKLVLVLFFMASLASAQIVKIPDFNFKAALLNASFDLNQDNEIQVEEALKVTTLYIDSLNIVDLTGIASFSSLILLYCEGNQLDSIDLRSNLLLSSLNCSNNNLSFISINDSLDSLKCSFNNLNYLGITGNVKLEYLECRNNNLKSADFSSNKALFLLDCSFNNLTSLNVKGLSRLNYLFCSNNKI